MSTTKRNSGKAYAMPTADIELFDIEDVIRTSGETQQTLEVGGDYSQTGWDVKITEEQE